MNIRRMKIEDYEKVYTLWNNTKGMGLRNADDSKEGINKYLKRNPFTNFVAEIDGNIVGTILSGHDGRRGFIYHTAVDQKYRNQKIGHLLVETAMEALRNEGITKVALVAYKDNSIGNSFWDSHGFEERVDLVYRNKLL